MDQSKIHRESFDPKSTQFGVERLQSAIREAKQLGYHVRSEWLGGSAAGWCEVGGRRILFVDLSLSVDEQLEQVETAIAVVKVDRDAA